ncbi:hypothetical protein DFH09DRAFT_1131513 [Mycena vulgaris]|nr:hypothetical protein DFH09DRAFT_1131513 [Mycena vulgaris]
MATPRSCARCACRRGGRRYVCFHGRGASNAFFRDQRIAMTMIIRFASKSHPSYIAPTTPPSSSRRFGKSWRAAAGQKLFSLLSQSFLIHTRGRRSTPPSLEASLAVIASRPCTRYTFVTSRGPPIDRARPRRTRFLTTGTSMTMPAQTPPSRFRDDSSGTRRTGFRNQSKHTGFSSPSYILA